MPTFSACSTTRPGFRNYWSAEHLDALPDQAVDVFCEQAADMVVPSPSQHAILPLGGVVARNADGWPIPSRTAPWVVHPLGIWENPADDERAKRWVHNLRSALEPWATGAVYLNFTGDEGHERVVAGVRPRQNYDRLAADQGRIRPQQPVPPEPQHHPTRGRHPHRQRLKPAGHPDGRIRTR